MNKPLLSYLGISAISLSVLTSCSTGDCNTNSGTLSLAIEAPTQYPAV